MAPLLDRRVVAEYELKGTHVADVVPMSVRRLARLAGMSPAAFRDPRGLTFSTADRVACALGLHPFEVWGVDWFEVSA